MGRKNKQKLLHHETCAAFSNKKKVEQLIQKLLNACVMPTDHTNEWTNFVEIHDLVERIRQFQTPLLMNDDSRIKNIEAFKTWLQEHSVIVNDVDIKETSEYGFGVFAVKDILAGKLLTSIPQDIILTADSALKSDYFCPFVKSQSVLIKMLNVRLALYLHCEKYRENSFFDPYIKVLPNEYTTTLYFSKDSIKLLQNTPAFSQAIFQFKSIARQYALFFNLFHTETAAQNLQAIEKIPVKAKNAFTFDAYRWAVSTVTTRQNIIPNVNEEDGQNTSVTLGLIPMWDMFNHSNGEVSTDYDTEIKHCKSYAMKDFKKDEEVTICYGKRLNSEFLIHNGFVPKLNPYNKVEIQLGISQQDRLFQKKVALLTKLNLLTSSKFSICTNNLIPPDMLAFMRVFLMDEEKLDFHISNSTADDLKNTTYDVGNIDGKIWSFLSARMNLLLLQMQKSMIDNGVMDKIHVKLVASLKNENRSVLESCKAYCDSRL